MPVSNDPPDRRRQNDQARRGERAQALQAGNPAWQSNSKVGSRYRVETNKAAYTWKYKNEGGLSAREIERLPILGSRGDFNRRPIAKVVVNEQNGLQSITYADPGSKKYRYKSLKASEGALRRNNWVIYVQLAIAASNAYNSKQIKYPEAISDLVLQAMFHASETNDGVNEPKPLNPVLYIFLNPWSFKKYVAENVPPILEMVEKAMKENKNFFDGSKSRVMRSWRDFCQEFNIDESVQRKGEEEWERFGDHSNELTSLIRERENMIARGVLNPSLRVLKQIATAGDILPGAIPMGPNISRTTINDTTNVNTSDDIDTEYGFDTTDLPDISPIVPQGYQMINGQLIATSSNLPPITDQTVTTTTTTTTTTIVIEDISIEKLMRLILNNNTNDFLSKYQPELEKILKLPVTTPLYLKNIESIHQSVQDFKRIITEDAWLNDVNIEFFVRIFNQERGNNIKKPYFIGPIAYNTHFFNNTISERNKNNLMENINWVICPITNKTINEHWYVLHVQIKKETSPPSYKIEIYDSLKNTNANRLLRYEEILDSINDRIKQLFPGINEIRPSFKYAGKQTDGSSCGIFSIFTMMSLHVYQQTEQIYYSKMGDKNYINLLRSIFATYLATKISLMQSSGSQIISQQRAQPPPQSTPQQQTSVTRVITENPSVIKTTRQKRMRTATPLNPSRRENRPQRTKKMPKRFGEFKVG